MPARVRSYALSGLTSNADIARVLARHFDSRITEREVVRWRAQEHRLEEACTLAVDELNAEMTLRAVQIAREGDGQMIRYLLDRRNPAFMPKSKSDITHATTLDDVLKSRSRDEDEEDLLHRGVIVHGT